MIEHWAQNLHPDNPVLVMVALKTWIVAAVFLPLVSVIAMFSIWWERKVSGHIQSRVGPMHTGAWHGWAQSIADGVKLILKEDLIPAGADRFLFRFAPYLAFAPVFAAFLALPFGPQWTYEDALNIGVLYLLAVLAVEAMGVIMAGWASNSKWAIYGAMREACQIVSYEIPLGLAILTGVLTAGTLHLVELGHLQGAGMWDWFIFHNPFIFASFLLYFVASLASNKRAPFDLPESESELVSGFHTEYSGLRFSFFFFAEYAGMFVVGAIQAALFLGAWNSPLGAWDPVLLLAGYDPVAAGQAYFSGTLGEAPTFAAKAAAINEAAAAAGREPTGMGPIGLIVANAYFATWFLVKAMGVVFVQIWLRWTLPRIRIDQVLHMCMKVLLPAGLVLLVGTAAWIWLVPQPAPGLAGEAEIVRLGHLTRPAPLLQQLTQGVLTLAGLAIAIAFLGVIAWAWLHRPANTLRTFHPDIMPVGPDVAFTGSDPEATGDEEAHE